ncbi:hypothetical protein OPV22_004667 [Ensete ventricosum]|uniref:Uncharacterized protein n=1 Tax=Ensete ventricosum TaxID=4639 RepID=A0AAV8RGS0_ENSVE|nr:hypothetical protein OPV22_004667 [Ensete ventricosum]
MQYRSDERRLRPSSRYVRTRVMAALFDTIQSDRSKERSELWSPLLEFRAIAADLLMLLSPKGAILFST